MGDLRAEQVLTEIASPCAASSSARGLASPAEPPVGLADPVQGLRRPAGVLGSVADPQCLLLAAQRRCQSPVASLMSAAFCSSPASSVWSLRARRGPQAGQRLADQLPRRLDVAGEVSISPSR